MCSLHTHSALSLGSRPGEGMKGPNLTFLIFQKEREPTLGDRVPRSQGASPFQVSVYLFVTVPLAKPRVTVGEARPKA